MLDRYGLVIANTTPLIALALIGELRLLPALYRTVSIPPAVHREVMVGGAKGIGIAELRSADWLQIRSLNDPRRADLLADLERGEAEVIALAQELNANLVIIDERLARRHALRLDLRLTGTLGVLIKAKQNGIVESIAPLIDKLRRSGIYLSTAVVAEALKLAHGV